MAHYAFLLPFIPALQPLIVHYRLLDLAIYTVGALIVLFLIVYGNQRPYIRVDQKQLCLFLHYRHNAECHNFPNITGYRRTGTSKAVLYFREHRPVNLLLKPDDLNNLVNILNNNNIKIMEK